MRNTRLFVAAGLLAVGGAAFAAIPLTDAVLYGTVTINGTPITATDNVTITARRAAGGASLGAYKMGDGGPSAGNNYIARIRLESLADGTAQSSDAALVGQTVFLYVSDNRPGQNGAEQLLQGSTYVVPRAGVIERRNLGAVTALPGDVNGDGVVNNQDVTPFVRVLLQLETDAGMVQRSDIDNSGTPDGGDIQLFVNIVIP